MDSTGLPIKDNGCSSIGPDLAAKAVQDGSPRSVARPSTSRLAAVGEWVHRELQCSSARRTAQRRDFLHLAGSSDHHRKLATSLQCHRTPCVARKQSSGAQGVRTSLHAVVGSATRTDSAGYVGATGGTKLGFSLDYLIKAAQEAAHGRRLAFTGAASNAKGKDYRTDENQDLFHGYAPLYALELPTCTNHPDTQLVRQTSHIRAELSKTYLLIYWRSASFNPRRSART